jgi:hypothetical protein
MPIPFLPFMFLHYKSIWILHKFLALCFSAHLLFCTHKTPLLLLFITLYPFQSYCLCKMCLFLYQHFGLSSLAAPVLDTVALVNFSHGSAEVPVCQLGKFDCHYSIFVFMDGCSPDNNTPHLLWLADDIRLWSFTTPNGQICTYNKQLHNKPLQELIYSPCTSLPYTNNLLSLQIESITVCTQ